MWAQVAKIVWLGYYLTDKIFHAMTVNICAPFEIVAILERCCWFVD